jgi:hypothetical protein
MTLGLVVVVCLMLPESDGSTKSASSSSISTSLRDKLGCGVSAGLGTVVAVTVVVGLTEGIYLAQARRMIASA